MIMQEDKELLKATVGVMLAEAGPLEAARYLVQTLFKDVKERAGTPYFGHLERVTAGIEDDRIKPIGYLHDVVEDIDGWTFEDLAEIGFDAFIVDGVRAVTKIDDAPYFDEMVRVGLTPQAIPVKKSDLKDNSNLLRLPTLPTEKDIERTRKYYLSWHYLDDVENGRTAPGTPFGVWMAAQRKGKQDFALLAKYSAAPAAVTATAAAAPAFGAPHR